MNGDHSVSFVQWTGWYSDIVVLARKTCMYNQIIRIPLFLFFFLFLLLFFFSLILGSLSHALWEACADDCCAVGGVEIRVGCTPREGCVRLYEPSAGTVMDGRTPTFAPRTTRAGRDGPRRGVRAVELGPELALDFERRGRESGCAGVVVAGGGTDRECPRMDWARHLLHVLFLFLLLLLVPEMTILMLVLDDEKPPSSSATERMTDD